MSIMERYISAYIVECLTGYKGEFPEYVELVKHSRPRNPLFKKVVRAIKSLDPRSTAAINLVKDIMKQDEFRQRSAEIKACQDNYKKVQ